MAKRDFVGCPVIFHNLWMVHGDICRTLFKVTYRITKRGHHIAQQLVGFRYRTSGLVNESCLDPAPGLHEARTITRRKQSEMETFDSLFALFETGFRLLPVPAFPQGAGIFWAKPSAQPFSPALSEKDQRGDDAQNSNPDENTDYD
jgi:hypothetical protein